MVHFHHPPCTLHLITVNFHYQQCVLIWCSCTIHHVLYTMVWCTPIMHNTPCILEWCTSIINHALCTLVHYISTMHCVASYGALPSWTEHLGTMHYNNDSSIVHVITLYFHYALISFLVITSNMHYAPCSLKWWVSLCKVHLRLVHFHYAK